MFEFFITESSQASGGSLIMAGVRLMPAKIYLSAFKVRIGVEAVQLLPELIRVLASVLKDAIVGA